MRIIRIIALTLTVFSSQSIADGLTGKVMCGYQGWFRAPGDNSGYGWRHYSTTEKFKPGHCTIDLWPDVSELPESEQYPTEFRHADGSVAKVYSPVNAATVDVHFKWMSDYGIDGVFLQRFVVSTRDPKFRKTLDQVLLNCRKAAVKHNRQWTLTYDLSGLKPGEINLLIEDWKRLKKDHKVGSLTHDTSYLMHRGKPLITLWGLGFSDRPFDFQAWQTLIDFFKNDPEFGGCSIMVGVPSYWRTLNRDAVNDPRLHKLLKQVDVISPWTVGRYGTPDQAEQFIRKTTTADLAWCKTENIDYLPVAFPGFSWQNLQRTRDKKAKFDAIPRQEGAFLWSQCWSYKQAGAASLFVAMFDELDEGTAIFKYSNNPPVGASRFLAEKNLPNDHYLWLTGKARELFQNNPKTLSAELPERK
ncbi:hypothetical protein NT6N_18960 [Oceaniferula spumae]|uniref:Xylosidase/arabinosidase n=1 Tax=Oceaniferula spumae TaxID=2979115 RepID=A0AAT9FLQ5_9BACT